MELSPGKLTVPMLFQKFPTFSVTQEAITVTHTFTTKCTNSKQTYIVLSHAIHSPRYFSLNKALKEPDTCPYPEQD
jgi:hypothetical protein